MRTGRERGLLFGPLAAAILAFAIAVLPVIVPGYDPVHQTVSEIGEVGSPARVPFTAMLLAVAICLLVFAWALWRASRQVAVSTLPGWLVGCTALSAAGVGWFAFPHPLHNVFGLSELVGYQAPIAFALAWRRVASSRGLVVFSGLMGALVWIAIAANLSVLDRGGVIWALERPVYGLVQRALFGAWFVWCAGLGLWLYRRARGG